MSYQIIDGKLVETKQAVVEEDLVQLCRLRDHYRSDVETFTAKLAEVEAKIQAAKSLGFVEPETL